MAVTKKTTKASKSVVVTPKPKAKTNVKAAEEKAATTKTKNTTKVPAKTSGTQSGKVVTPKVVRVNTSRPVIATVSKPLTDSGRTVYHVTKRDKDSREWKVFIQESNKVIKLFETQEEALKFAQNLCKNKDDGSYVVLHGLNGKIRRY